MKMFFSNFFGLLFALIVLIPLNIYFFNYLTFNNSWIVKLIFLVISITWIGIFTDLGITCYRKELKEKSVRKD